MFEDFRTHENDKVFIELAESRKEIAQDSDLSLDEKLSDYSDALHEILSEGRCSSLLVVCAKSGETFAEFKQYIENPDSQNKDIQEQAQELKETLITIADNAANPTKFARYF